MPVVLSRFAAVTLVALTTLPGVAFAQQGTAPTRTGLTLRKLGKATERKTLAVAVLSVGNGGAVLKPDAPDAPTVTAYLAGDTKYYRLPTRTAPPAFAVGEKVTVRLAYYGVGPTARVYVAELWDTAVYEEHQKLRTEVFAGVVRQTPPSGGGAASGYLTLAAKEGEYTATYRVTDKTVFYRGDTRVPPSAYPVGAEAAVKPRGLPSGGIMAYAVAESPTALDRAYRDTLSVWHGVAERVDPASGTLYIKRNDGAARAVAFPRNLTISDEKTRDAPGAKKLYLLAELPGKPVVVRLKRGEKPGPNGLRSAVSISVAESVKALTPPDATETAREQEQEAPPE